jgi:hypothetical protein
MKTAGIWKYIHAERAAVADTLEGLTPQQWAAPSWCGHWTVHMTAAHILAAEQTPGRFYLQLLRAGRTNLLIGAKKRIAGLRLAATDCTWSTGTGQEVAGPLLSLIMAMSGRRQACRDLVGDGLPTLADR